MTKSSLKFVDFVDSKGKPTPGLVPVPPLVPQDLPIEEQAAIFEARSFKDIDFVFFRRFTDGRSSQIAAYVIDNTDKRLDEKSLAELHRQVWLHGMVPLLYVAWPTRIDILSCARGPDFLKTGNDQYHYNPAKSPETIKTAGLINSELRNFSALRLADGTFWDDPANRHLADYSKAAHQSLIQAVLEADNELDGSKNPLLRRLLLLMVLIKYLEDRQVFPNENWFGRFHKGAKNFFEVLKGGNPEEVYQLLSTLENKFNGDVFVLQSEGQQRLTKTILNRFAELVEARTLNRQRHLWKQFSFEHLPVEIISHLYQRFVQGGHGAVYTPPFLASLILDHAMPYKKLTGEERILDPACGSGVFLVGAFRRLINTWRSRNGWQRPTVKTLKEILKHSVYGIELDPNAVDLTAFSLSLAICDALQPEVIWKELRFERLRNSNLFEADFFDKLIELQEDKPTFVADGFDVIVGNPPFESELTSAGIEINNRIQRKNRNRGSLPDNQTAYLFLEQALSVLRTNGRLCLIQPAGFLYNQKAQTFRTSIFRNHKVDTVLDFTSIRKLYEADPKTVAILVSANRPTKTHQINHLTFRRTVSVHERICFELDHYDHHTISQTHSETDPFVWRANLLGGGRLIEISRRLQNMRTMGKYLSDCIKNKKWDYGEGYIAARSGRRTPAPFLTGKPLIPTNAFTDKGIDKTMMETVKETHFRSAYTEDRYSAPLILIRELDSLPIAFWDEGFIAYRNQIVGIHAPSSQKSDLSKLFKYLQSNHKICRLSCALNSSRFIVAKATSILKHDIDMLPYPESINELSLSFWEEALCGDVLTYLIDYARLGQNSDLLQTAANKKKLDEYSAMFLRMLGSVYDNLKAADPIFLDGLICQPFYFGEQPNLSWLTKQTEGELQKLIYSEERHKYLRTIRVLRLYLENVLLIVKPDRLRYWISSTAIRDADETLIDLRQQGY